VQATTAQAGGIGQKTFAAAAAPVQNIDLTSRLAISRFSRIATTLRPILH
jgi:hypothetical protein